MTDRYKELREKYGDPEPDRYAELRARAGVDEHGEPISEVHAKRRLICSYCGHIGMYGLLDDHGEPLPRCDRCGTQLYDGESATFEELFAKLGGIWPALVWSHWSTRCVERGQEPDLGRFVSASKPTMRQFQKDAVQHMIKMFGRERTMQLCVEHGVANAVGPNAEKFPLWESGKPTADSSQGKPSGVVAKEKGREGPPQPRQQAGVGASIDKEEGEGDRPRSRFRAEDGSLIDDVVTAGSWTLIGIILIAIVIGVITCHSNSKTTRYSWSSSSTRPSNRTEPPNQRYPGLDSLPSEKEERSGIPDQRAALMDRVKWYARLVERQGLRAAAHGLPPSLKALDIRLPVDREDYRVTRIEIGKVSEIVQAAGTGERYATVCYKVFGVAGPVSEDSQPVDIHSTLLAIQERGAEWGFVEASPELFRQMRAKIPVLKRLTIGTPWMRVGAADDPHRIERWDLGGGWEFVPETRERLEKLIEKNGQR